MVNVELTLDIACRPEQAFDLWTDMRNDVRWNPICESSLLRSPSAVGVGASFTGRYKGFGQVTETVTAYDRPRRVARGGTTRGFVVSNDLRFEADGGKTRVSFAGSVKPLGAFKLLTPILGIMMRRQAGRTLQHFKRALEAGMRAAPAP